MIKIEKYLNDKSIEYTKSEYNSNNAWGFGGMAGYSYEISGKDITIRVGKCCYRHAGSHAIVKIFKGHACIYNEYRISIEELENILNNH